MAKLRRSAPLGVAAWHLTSDSRRAAAHAFSFAACVSAHEMVSSFLDAMASSPTYITLAGDEEPTAFLREWLPIVYVTAGPLLVLIFQLIVVPSCNPDMIVVSAYPPPPSGAVRSRGYRNLRRAMIAARASARIAAATEALLSGAASSPWSAAFKTTAKVAPAPWAASSAKSQKKLAAQSDITGDLRSKYGTSPNLIKTPAAPPPGSKKNPFTTPGAGRESHRW